LLIAKSKEAQYLLPQMANRHGLVAGATGTGKTVTLQVMAEAFSRAGVPVFAADVKGDLSGISRAGKENPKIAERAKKLGLEDFVYEASPVMVPGNQYADITEVRTDDSADYLPNRQTGYQSLETHLLTVRAAVATLADRIEQLAALRASDGRSLPPERRAILHSIKDRIDRALTACQPRAQASEVMSLRRELLELETSILTS